MRRYGLPDAYEQLKNFSRGVDGLDKAAYLSFIETLAIPAEDKKRLVELTPALYTGIAARLAAVALEQSRDKNAEPEGSK
jgi:adenylosuccinate lyase